VVAVRGDAARAALVVAAEQLFAQRGIEGVSLRDVSAAAGQRNHNAAQYHFGDRLGLVTAVYENRMRVVDERRRAHLEGVADDDIRGLVAAIVVPLVEVVSETDGWYARFQARLRWEPTSWEALQQVASQSGFAATMRKLNRALDDLSRPVRHSRLDQLMTLIIGTIAGWEAARARDAARLSVDALANELISTGVAVLMAPVLQGANA
jgi:AcrR family transcriptional regulator